MDGGNKKDVKVLSTDDIRRKAPNWNLAGDAGLLAHLEQLSEKIYSKTQDTNLKFNELAESYEEVHKKIDNVTNQFLALQNCQFVENRVYDEETPSEEIIKEEIVNTNEKEKQLLQQYKQAVNIGIKLLDSHFEEVEVSFNSDSDEDVVGEDDETASGNASIIWKPKNPYSGRKFPLLIGSSEWWQDDKVGLGSSEENLNIEKEVSDSESDLDTQQKGDKQVQISSSSSIENESKSISSRAKTYESSEDLFGLDKNDAFKTSDPDFFATNEDSFVRKPGIFSNDISYHESIVSSRGQIESSIEQAIKEKIINAPEPDYENENSNKMKNDFTKELASKLGNFTKKDNLNREAAVASKNGAQENLLSNRSDNLFQESGELEENDDLFSSKTKDLPIGKNKFFFESEKDSDLFGESDKLFSDPHSNVFNSETPPKTEFATQFDSQIKKSATDLFSNLNDDDDGEDDEDSLFSSKPVKNNNALSKSPPSSKSTSDYKPSDLSIRSSLKGKGLFDYESDEGDGESDIFRSMSKKIKTPASSVTEEKEPSHLFTSSILSKSPAKENFIEKNSLAGQDDDASNANNRPDRPTDDNKFDFFSDELKTSIEDNKFSLFSGGLSDHSDRLLDPPPDQKNLKFVPGLEEDDDDTSLFLEKPKQPDTISISSSRSSLFDDITPSKSRLASVFEKDKSNSRFEDELFSASENSLFGIKNKKEDDLFLSSTKKAMNPMKNNSLFGDLDDADDLFNNAKESKAVDSSLFAIGGKSEVNAAISEAAVKPIGKLSGSLFGDDSSQESKKSQKETMNTWAASNHLKDHIFFERGSSILGEGSKEEKIDEHLKKTKEITSENVSENETDLNSRHQTAVKAAVKKLEETSGELTIEKSLFPIKIVRENSLFGDTDEFFGRKEEEKISVGETKPMPPNISEPKEEFGNTAKPIGKLNISQNLKNRLEAAVKPVSSDSSLQIGIRKSVAFGEEREKDELDKPCEPSTNLLKCPSKDRVKIPVRRRPQSRRARQEAIRNSGANFFDSNNDDAVLLRSNDLTSSEKDGDSNSHLVKNSVSSNSIVVVTETEDSAVPEKVSFSGSRPLSPSTDEDDIFNVPGLDTRFEKEDQNFFKSNIFEASTDTANNDRLLFDDGPVLSPQAKDENFTYRIENSTAFEREEKEKRIEDIKEKPVEKKWEEKDVEEKSLFASPQTKLKGKKPGNRLFDSDDKDDSDGFGDDGDDEEEDNLFKIKGNKKILRKSQDFLSTPVCFMQNTKKPLFKDKLEDDDDDDDEDLFGGKFKVSVTESFPDEKQITKVPNMRKKVEEPKNKREEPKDKSSNENKSFVDPLGLMSNQD